MIKRWTTTNDFITYGKTAPANTVVETEGMSSVGDGGALKLYRTGNTGTPSQDFVTRGNNTCTDASGTEWKIIEGTTVTYNGTTDWFNNGFGSTGVGNYVLTDSTWIKATVDTDLTPLESDINTINSSITSIESDVTDINNTLLSKADYADLTKAQEELLSAGSKVYPDDGSVLANGMIVTAGTTHLRVLIGGEPAIVLMSPVASGVVSLLTETSATIGTTPIVFKATTDKGPDNANSFLVSGNQVDDDTVKIQRLFDNSRNITFEDDIATGCRVTAPIKVRSVTSVRGNGNTARIGNEFTDFSTIEKTTNTTVDITNPEQPTQTVDTIMYLDGEWEDGKYPQKLIIEKMALVSKAQDANTHGIYIIQGGNVSFRNVDIFDCAYAIKGYEVWSNVFERVVTNGKIYLQSGTSNTFNQCASGGLSSDGNTSGGFHLSSTYYSTMNACTSDGGISPAYQFSSCNTLTLNSCASEYPLDGGVAGDVGQAIAFTSTGTQAEITNFFLISRPFEEIGSRAAFSFNAPNSNVVFRGGRNALGGFATSDDHVDVYVVGSGNVITFHNYRFFNGDTATPKISWSATAGDSKVIVYDKEGKKYVYYTDGAGNTLVDPIDEIVGDDSQGYVMREDGVLEQWYQVPVASFQTASSTFTTVQGINWYRSAAASFNPYLKPFLNGTLPKVTVEIQSGLAGSRIIIDRVSQAGESATRSGEIQLISVDDFISGGNAYNNLQTVTIRAIGRWA